MSSHSVSILTKDVDLIDSDLIKTLRDLTVNGISSNLNVPLPLDVDPDVAEQVIQYVTKDKFPPLPVTCGDLRRQQEKWNQAAGFIGIPDQYPWTYAHVSFLDALKDTHEQYSDLLRNELKWRNRLGRPGVLDGAPYTLIHPIVTEGSKAAEEKFVCDSRSVLLDREGKCCSGGRSWTPTDDDEVRRRSVMLHDWASDFFGSSMPWFSDNRTQGSGIVLAGGFMAMVLMGVVTLKKGELPLMPSGTDIDIFMCISHRLCCSERPGGGDDKIAELGHDLIYRVVMSMEKKGKNMGIEAVPVSSSTHVTNIMVTQRDSTSGYIVRSVKLQLILAAAETPSHILTGFDISACQLLYDGSWTVYATRSAAWTLKFGVVVFDQTKFSKSAIYRYKKYMDRYGLLLYIPGVPADMIEAATQKVKGLMRKKDAVELTGVGSMLAALVNRGWMPSPERNQSDYTDPSIAKFISGCSYNKRMYMYPVFRLRSDNGRFTGAVNPVDVNIFADFYKLLL